MFKLRAPIGVLTALSGCTLHAVAHRLTKIPGSDEFLEQLHLVLYKRRGTASSRKKDTRAFSGWTFAGDSKVPACGPPLALPGLPHRQQAGSTLQTAFVCH